MYPIGAQWLPELEADDSDLINQWQMKSINNSVNNHCFNPHQSGSYSAYPSSSAESIQENSKAGMPKSAQKDFSSYTSTQKESQQISPSSFPSVISFGDSNSTKSDMHHDPYGMRKCTVKTEAGMMSVGEMNFSDEISPSFTFGTVEYGEPIKKGCNRTALQAQDHVLAERKRRERLSERFVALSAVIPDLKKLDKASVLGGAIKYLKQLEERIKILEDEKGKKQKESINISSVPKRARLAYSDETSSSDESSEISHDHASPEIEVRISDTNVLVRIYCVKRGGIIKEILGEIEKLPLGIISSSVIPFGSTTLSITVIAQMDGEDCMRAQDIANGIRLAIQKII